MKQRVTQNQRSGSGKERITMKEAYEYCARDMGRPITFEGCRRFQVKGVHVLFYIYSYVPNYEHNYEGFPRNFRWQIFQERRPGSGGVFSVD